MIGQRGSHAGGPEPRRGQARARRHVGVARVLSEDAMFFKDGKVVERGALRDILKNPKVEETRRMIEAAAPGRPVESAPLRL